MKSNSFKSFARKNIVVIFLVMLCLGFGIGTSDVFSTGNIGGIVKTSSFLSASNIVNLTTQMAINAMLSAGLTYVIILGAILVLVLSAVVVGGICGAFNGIMITKFKVVPMITTLAMLNMARGLCFVLSGGTAVFGVANNYSWLGGSRFLQTPDKPTGWIPVITLFVVLCVFIMHTLLSKTVFGRHVYATGSNIKVAHLSGINTDRVTLICHILCAVMAALGGVLNASKLQNGQPAACDGYEMYAIAATVLGGTSLSGGRGSVGRAMFGVAIIAVINNGMNLMHINSYWQKVVIGLIILLAVILDMAQFKKEE